MSVLLLLTSLRHVTGVRVFFLFTILEWGQAWSHHPPTRLHSRPGHYPHVWCQLSDVILSTRDINFYYGAASDVDVEAECAPLTHIWPISALPASVAPPVCEEEYEEGHAFTMYYAAGSSNYYHLHKDMAIPLYQALHHAQDSPPESVLLMPSVESSRLKAIDWDTDAFRSSSLYWMQVMRPLMKDNMILMPLDRALLNTSSTICLKSLYMGTAKVNYENPEIVQGYVKFMKSQLHVLERPLALDDLRVGLITRDNRRRILNEPELLEAVRPVVGADLIQFQTLSVREQMAVVQRYAVLIGVNGAGLTNALFRPQHAVAIQLVPYRAELNHAAMGDLLSATGPYMEWHNRHLSLHRAPPGADDRSAYSQGDTIVHVAEFKELVEKALIIVKDRLLDIKDEL